MTVTYEAIATYTAPSAVASYTFSSIPSTYTDLRLIVLSSNTSGDSGVVARFNGDTANNYSNTGLYGNGTTAASFRESNISRVYVGRHDTTISSSVAEIQNYSNTTTYKTVLARGNDATLTIVTAGLWRSTAAISSIVVFDQSALNFNAGSTFSLYGIKAE